MNQKFPYILRISEKAKHVRFQVSVEKGLEIVVPKRFNASRVPSLVEKNSHWIERAFKAKAFQALNKFARQRGDRKRCNNHLSASRDNNPQQSGDP